MSNTEAKAMEDLGIVDGTLKAMQTVGSIVADSLKAQAAATGVQAVVAIVRTNMGSAWPAALDTPVGAALAEVFIPGLLLAGVEAFGSTIPGATHARGVLQQALKGISQQKMAEAAEAFKPLLGQLIALGAGSMQPSAGELHGATIDTEATPA